MMSQMQGIEKIYNASAASKTYNLLQFKKALREEAYELCPYWAGQALKSGARKSEIALIIRNPSLHLEEPPSFS